MFDKLQTIAKLIAYLLTAVGMDTILALVHGFTPELAVIAVVQVIGAFAVYQAPNKPAEEVTPVVTNIYTTNSEKLATQVGKRLPPVKLGE